MVYLLIWLVLGFAGWAALMMFRFLTEGKPKYLPLYSYINGFLFSLVLGPLCFVFLSYLIFRWWS